MNRETFVVKKRWVVLDTAANPPRPIATFATEQAATEYARKLNSIRRKK